LTPETQRQIVMAERPSGALRLRHFKTVVSPIPPRPADAVLLRNIFVSIAPHARAVMQGPTYRPQLVADELIPSSVIAEVIAGPADGPAPESVVAATGGRSTPWSRQRSFGRRKPSDPDSPWGRADCSYSFRSITARNPAGRHQEITTPPFSGGNASQRYLKF